MRPPELNPRSRLPALSERLEGFSCAGGTRRFRPALRRCHGSKAHRRCAAYLAEKLETRSEEQRLNSSHLYISYAVFCLKKKQQKKTKEIAHTKRQHCPSTTSSQHNC